MLLSPIATAVVVVALAAATAAATAASERQHLSHRDGSNDNLVLNNNNNNHHIHADLLNNQTHAAIAGFALDFSPLHIGERTRWLVGGRVRCVERPDLGSVVTTEPLGNFVFPGLRVGAAATLVLEVPGGWYVPTQGPTVVVPRGGLGFAAGTGKPDPHGLTAYGFQSVDVPSFDLLKELIEAERGRRMDPAKCVFVTTVAGVGRTLFTRPQGEPGAVVALDPPAGGSKADNRPYYFGAVDNFTWPFTPDRTETSFDGGVVVVDVAVRPDTPYVWNATKPGVEFTPATLRCQEKGLFVNAAPTLGIRVKQKQMGL